MNTETQDTVITENSNDVQVQEPETATDNSIKEPELESDNSNDVPESQEPDNSTETNSENDLILGKFKDVDDLANAYQNIQSQQGQQAKELGDLRRKAQEYESFEEQKQLFEAQKEEFARMLGFSSSQELATSQAYNQYESDLARFTANEYAKYLGSTASDELKNLILTYSNTVNPYQRKSLLEQIEYEFSPDIVKQVDRQVQKFKAQIEAQQNQAQFESLKKDAQAYLENVFQKYDTPEYFKNDKFYSLYSEAFKALGTNLDTNEFINLLESYVQSRIDNHSKNIKAKVENDNATDALNPELNKLTADKTSSKSLLDMDEDELAKAVSKYI